MPCLDTINEHNRTIARLTRERDAARAALREAIAIQQRAQTWADRFSAPYPPPSSSGDAAARWRRALGESDVKEAT